MKKYIKFFSVVTFCAAVRNGNWSPSGIPCRCLLRNTVFQIWHRIPALGETPSFCIAHGVCCQPCRLPCFPDTGQRGLCSAAAPDTKSGGPIGLKTHKRLYLERMLFPAAQNAFTDFGRNSTIMTSVAAAYIRHPVIAGKTAPQNRKTTTSAKIYT